MKILSFLKEIKNKITFISRFDPKYNLGHRMGKIGNQYKRQKGGKSNRKDKSNWKY